MISRPIPLLIIFLIAATVGFAVLRGTLNEIQQPVSLPQVDYAQSTTCVNCHPNHYQSWQQTYHSRMTQRASPTAVVGDFDDATYTFAGITSRFTREGDNYFIETLSTEGQMTRFPVVMTVGSRRMQQYVTQINDRHIRLPLAWHIEEGRWIHLNGGFLYPDGTDFNNHTALWDANCIFCHNVKAQPGYDFDTQLFDSQVAEFGIACEACHGPAAEHIQRNTNPLRRYALYVGDRDPTLYSPYELSDQQQIQVCGHCHGQRTPNPLERIEEFVGVGDPYTVGDDLQEYITPIQIDSHLEGVDLSLRFWQDGTPRLTAYEYQGILLSTEHEESGLTCISCHQMHGGDPKGMITEEMRGVMGCVQCHTEIGTDISQHTKHLPDSSGSDCYACHMPPITYGLLTIHPTHHIQNPDPTRAWRFEMPEACTLCHTDETAVWSAQTTAALYQHPLPADLPPDPAFTTAESIRTLLSGDVIQRAVAIHALTNDASYTPDAQARLWAVPFLLISMADEYPAIRYMAYRGLKQLITRADLPIDSLPYFDHLADAATRTAVLQQWQTWWAALEKDTWPHPGPAVPLDDNWQPIPDTVQALLAAQDAKIITIGE